MTDENCRYLKSHAAVFLEDNTDIIYKTSAWESDRIYLNNSLTIVLPFTNIQRIYLLYW